MRTTREMSCFARPTWSNLHNPSFALSNVTIVLTHVQLPSHHTLSSHLNYTTTLLFLLQFILLQHAFLHIFFYFSTLFSYYKYVKTKMSFTWLVCYLLSNFVLEIFIHMFELMWQVIFTARLFSIVGQNLRGYLSFR